MKKILKYPPKKGFKSEIRELKDGIKKLIDIELRKRLEKFEKNMDLKREKSISKFKINMKGELLELKTAIEANEISKFLGAIRKNRESIERIENRIRDFERIKKALMEMKKPVKEKVTEEIFREFEKINEAIEQNAAKNNKFYKKINNWAGNVNTKIEELKKLEILFKKMNAEHMTRDMESLKTKMQWLEENIEKINLKPLYTKIKEIEQELRATHVASPLVIE